MFDVVITPAGVREDLVACCEDAAEWRLHRASELWQNRRDLAAVDALEAAAESIAELPDDDPQLVRLAEVCERLSDDERVLAFTEQRRVVRSHGYDGAVAPSALLAQVTRGAEVILGDQSRSGREPVCDPARGRCRGARASRQGRCGCPRLNDAIGADRNHQGSPLKRSSRAIPQTSKGAARGA